MIQLIMCVDSKNGIAKNGIMPWPKNKIDLQRFSFLTTKTTVIMGKGTWDAVDMPSPLPNRENIVVTSASELEGATCMTIENVKNYLRNTRTNQIVSIIGGAQLAKELIDYVDNVFLTVINHDFDCDTFLDLSFLDLFYHESNMYFPKNEENFNYDFCFKHYKKKV